MTIIACKGGYPLYHQYPGQHQAQPAYVEIDPEDGTICASWKGEIGSAIPMRNWQNRTCRYAVPCGMSLAAVNALLRGLAPLADRVINGYSREGDHGTYTPDATKASRKIFAICESLFDVYYEGGGNWLTAVKKLVHVEVNT